MKKRWFLPALATLGLIAALMPAFAHHSFSQFDMSKTLTLKGTVKTLEWTNPHTWLWLDVPDGKGGDQVWGLEGRAIGEMSRHGWSRTIVKPGDKITVELHPLRDGRSGGSLGKVTLSDGRVLGDTLAAPAQ